MIIDNPINNPLNLPNDAARTLLNPLRPSGTKMAVPSQQIAAKNEERTEPRLANFSFITSISPLSLKDYIRVQLLICSKLSATIERARETISSTLESVIV